MSDARQFKFSFQDETAVNQRNLRNLFYALRTVDELVSLLEIRVEELENFSLVKELPDVIDRREISVLIDDKRGESP